MNQPDRKRKQKITFLSRTTSAATSLIVLSVALALFSSALITAFHFHPNLETRPDCAICKSASDLSSGDKHDGIVLIPLEVVQTVPVIPQILSVSTIFIRSLNSRAPPV